MNFVNGYVSIAASDSNTSTFNQSNSDIPSNYFFLKSDFFKNDSIAQNILQGQSYDVETESPFNTDGTYNLNGFSTPTSTHCIRRRQTCLYRTGSILTFL